MSKFLSGREREFKVGIVSYTENNTVLQVVGNSNFTGIVTAAYFYGDGSNLTNIPIVGAAATVAISTTAPVSPTEGDLWFNSELGRTFVYYNDGSSSQWVDTAPFNQSTYENTVGISSNGTVIGYGATVLDFRGAGISTVTVGSGVGTIYVQGGGSGTVSISSAAPVSPSNGDLWYNIDYGRTFVYYDEATLGVGATAFWVDAAPFNTDVAPSTPGKTSTTFTATDGQTSFSVSYSVGYIDVFLNGIRLNSSEFSENGSSVVLNVGASAGDIVDVVEYRMGIGDTGPSGAPAALTIGTRSGAVTQNITGIAFTVSLRSGIGTVSI